MSATGVPHDVDTYRRHATELIRHATVLVGPDDAPDVVTDAVLAAFGSPQWPAVENRRAYLYRAVLTRGLSHRRSATRRRMRETVVALRTPARVDAPDSAVDAHRALATLSEQQRAVVFLTYWEDQSPVQIAVSEGAVRKQLARARDGGTIAWVDDGGLISMALEPEIGQPERVAELPGGYVKDLDLSDSAAIVSIFQVPERPALLVPLDAGDAVELEGTTATFGPTG